MGTLPTGHKGVSSTLTLISKGPGTLQVEKYQVATKRNNYFASSHASHTYSPRSTNNTNSR